MLMLEVTKYLCLWTSARPLAKDSDSLIQFGEYAL